MTAEIGLQSRFSVSVLNSPTEQWNEFVLERADSSIYHLSGWAELARDAFGHAAFFLEARDQSNHLLGVLPLVQQRSLLLGNFVTSLPFFNYGGVLTDYDDVAEALMAQARQVGSDLGCSYVEFRDIRRRPGAWMVRTDKVSMVLNLPSDFAMLSQQLGAKLRSQVKRVDREQPSVRVGGFELVDDFYGVFAHNMRELGTPVYPCHFFRTILERFPHCCNILMVYRGGVPVAGGFLIIHKGRAEIPWAACLSEAKPLGFNMKLYWEVLSFVVERGCSIFDFGRSTIDAGTYKFKKQWGAQPLQLYWHRWVRHSPRQNIEGSATDGRLMRYAVSMWRRLPLSVANRLGPLVSPSLPW